MRLAGHRRRRAGALQQPQNFLLHEVAQAFAALLPFADRFDDLTTRGDADVGHQQNLFERIRRFHFDLSRARFRYRRESDHLVELVETFLQLLRGLLQSLL